MIVAAAEWVFMLMIVVLFGSQVLWPVCRGTRLFPIIRREGRLRRELSEVRQEATEIEVEEQITRERERLELERMARAKHKEKDQ